MNDTLFHFEGELTVDDPRMQTVTGYLCATPGLLAKLKQQEGKSLPSGTAIPSGTIDNPNFYTQYDLTTGTVGILSTYWTQQMEKGRVVEKFTNMDLSLSKEEELLVIAAMESHCQKEYGQTCMSFLNELRRETGRTNLPDPNREKEGTSPRPSFESLVQSAKTKAACAAQNTEPRQTPQSLHSRV